MKRLKSVDDILDLRSGDRISVTERKELFTGPAVGNTPQKGINWLGSPPDYDLVIIRSTATYGYGDRWIDKDAGLYLYYLMIENRGAANASINYNSKENSALIDQPEHKAPVLLTTNSATAPGIIDVQGRFRVVTRCHDNPVHLGMDSVLLQRDNFGNSS